MPSFPSCRRADGTYGMFLFAAPTQSYLGLPSSSRNLPPQSSHKYNEQREIENACSAGWASSGEAFEAHNRNWHKPRHNSVQTSFNKIVSSTRSYWPSVAPRFLPNTPPLAGEGAKRAYMKDWAALQLEQQHQTTITTSKQTKEGAATSQSTIAEVVPP